MAIALKSYIVSGNTYVPVSVLHSEIPVHLDISNGENSILRADFYFQKFVLFKGQKGIKYSIRFLNGGTAKLILMDFKVLTETVHVKDALTPQDIVSHSSRATELYHDITLLINGFKRIWMLEYNSITKISGDIRNYSYYSIA